MLDLPALFDGLAAAGFGTWRDALEPVIGEKLAVGAHGDLPRWRETLSKLPPAGHCNAVLDQPVVKAGPAEFSPDVRRGVRGLLQTLIPWRKGPFQVGDILIDAEWRSDLKWARLAAAIAPLDGRQVLDVGCGNGYYALRMCGAGARTVVGIDPALLPIVQFQAIRHWLPAVPVHLLPLRLNELPPGSGFFDTVFSMGVLYHQREPLLHLRQLRATLRPGGELVLETLVLPGDSPDLRQPKDRYARMRNVWRLPTMPQLERWLVQGGFANVRVADVSRTTTDEQRSTEWMPFESLRQALDADDPSLTVEGWPAPRRAIVIGSRP